MILKTYLRFDTWMSRSVMNPMFIWIQTWLHCNRFQLIALCIKCVALLYMFIAIGFALEQSYFYTFLYLYWFVDMTGAEGRESYALIVKTGEDMEQNPAKPLSHKIKEIVMYARQVRTSYTGFFLWSSLVANLGAMIIYRVSMVSICFGFLMLSFLLFLYLFDVDDVSPDERKSIFDPAEQTQA